MAACAKHPFAEGAERQGGSTELNLFDLVELSAWHMPQVVMHDAADLEAITDSQDHTCKPCRMYSLTESKECWLCKCCLSQR